MSVITNFLSHPEARDVAETPFQSVAHMSDIEIQQSIVADLVVTREECGGLYWTEIFRFVRTRHQIDRVLNALVQLIISRVVVEHGQFLALRDETGALQLAMDFAGVYQMNVPGINYPDGLMTLSDEGREIIEGNGVDAVAAMLYAETKYPDATDTMQ
jgi:hypothetical protein